MEKPKSFVTLYAVGEVLEKDKQTGEGIGIRVQEILYNLETITRFKKNVKFEEKNPHASTFEGDPIEKKFHIDEDDVFLTSPGHEVDEKTKELLDEVNGLFEKAVENAYVVITEPITIMMDRKAGTIKARTSFVQLPLEAGRKFYMAMEKDLFTTDTYTLKEALAKEKEVGISS